MFDMVDVKGQGTGVSACIGYVGMQTRRSLMLGAVEVRVNLRYCQCVSAV